MAVVMAHRLSDVLRWRSRIPIPAGYLPFGAGVECGWNAAPVEKSAMDIGPTRYLWKIIAA